jgi:multidrug efflux pump subunit AcrA (membrane-fusion protein)
MAMTPFRSFSLFAGLITVALTACGKAEAPKIPEKITPVTLSQVAQKDLPITESAVGALTGVGAALEYDPTQVSGGTLYVRLPFPEHVATRLKIGQGVTLTAFSDGERAVHGRIREIRPALNLTTLSREVVVAITNAAGWRPQGSIRGEVTLGVRRNALVVPEQAVVLRPAGGVLYAIENDIARERAVKTGIVREGVIEIVEGGRLGETVAVDGAGLLSDGAKIMARDSQKP